MSEVKSKRSSEDYGQQVANYWSRVAARGELGFWNLPGWKEHQNILASGSPDKDWLEVLKQKVPKQICNEGRALSLGCGSGCLEPIMLSKKLCHRVDACDISHDLIAGAQRSVNLKNLPIHYFQADLNKIQLEENKYDLVIASGILHHIQNLENLFEQVFKTLKPSGVFIVYDYVGPSRFQWSEEQKLACNEILKSIPWSYRWKRGYPYYYYFGRSLFSIFPFLRYRKVAPLVNQVLPEYYYHQFIRLKQSRLFMKKVVAPPPEQFWVTDPSEAVRSEEILPLIRKKFEEKMLIPQGGTIIQPIFNRIVGNFVDSKKGVEYSQHILKKERDLITKKGLTSDFIAAIFTKKSL